jgi:hypothetical protein
MLPISPAAELYAANPYIPSEIIGCWMAITQREWRPQAKTMETRRR